MIIIYNLAIRGYYFLVLIASIWNDKASKWINGRKDWESKLEGKLQTDRPVVWVHCSSLGEFEQGRPVIEKIKQEKPDHQILLTFFSPSGFEVQKNYDAADVIMYLPLDTKKNARKFIKLANPAKVVFVKYEFWYHILNELKEKVPMEKIAKESEELIKTVSQRFSDQEMGKVLGKLDNFLETATVSIRRIENRFHDMEGGFNKTLDGLKESMENISKFTRELAEDPTIFIRKRAKKRSKR